jgi:hypothetical protein
LLIPILKAEYAQHIAISPPCPLRNREGLAIVITTCVLSQVAGRSTKAEKDFRVSTVYGHLCNGWSRGQILQFAADEWGTSERQADQYIADARVKIDQDCNLSRQAFLAECLQRLRTYEVAAAKRGQMQVATNSVRLQAELVGLTGKTA